MKQILTLFLLGISTLLATEASSYRVQNSVVDTTTHLQWQDDPYIEESIDIWRKGENYCKALVLDQADDWRLPTHKELLLLAKNKELKAKFHHLDVQVFWSGDDDPEDELNAITVFIQNGFVATDDKCNENYIICVRRR